MGEWVGGSLAGWLALCYSHRIDDDGSSIRLSVLAQEELVQYLSYVCTEVLSTGIRAIFSKPTPTPTPTPTTEPIWVTEQFSKSVQIRLPVTYYLLDRTDGDCTE